MFAVIIIIIVIWIVMWGFYKFMYPRAPKSMMPKKGDVITPRQCNFVATAWLNTAASLKPSPTWLQIVRVLLAKTKHCFFAIMSIKQIFMQVRFITLTYKQLDYGLGRKKRLAHQSEALIVSSRNMRL